MGGEAGAAAAALLPADRGGTQGAGESANCVADLLSRARSGCGHPPRVSDSMDWKARLRAAFALDGHTPDDDVLEELSQHAAAAYERARADGCSQADAERHVDTLVAEWRRNAPVLKRRPRRPPVVEPPAASAPF